MDYHQYSKKSTWQRQEISSAAFWELLVANNSQLNEIYLRVSLVTLGLESILIHSLCKHSETCFCQNNLTKLFCQIIDLYWSSSIDFWVTNNFTITIWEWVITIAKMRGMFSCSYHLSTFFFFFSPVLYTGQHKYTTFIYSSHHIHSGSNCPLQ